MTPGERDPFDLTRFVDAQARIYEDALRELYAGRKRTHWMWFVFPQLRGLGHSPMAVRYGIASLEEARAYLQHSLLGSRLRAATDAAIGLSPRPLSEIFDPPDDLKFCSSMTLFAAASGGEGNIFLTAIDRYCSGRGDAMTLELLGRAR